MPLQFQLKRFASQMSALQGWALILEKVAVAYLAGLIICGGSLFFVYQDATSRQKIPYEIGVNNTITAVKAIGKDDVLESPRYAVKHYRRLLLELAKQEDSQLAFEEKNADGSINYAVPLLSAEVLFKSKSTAFANFYIDIVLRYARALLAKGQLRASVSLLQQIVDEDEIFYRIGNPERMTQCCRTLSLASEDASTKFAYLQKAIDMLADTFQNITFDTDYLLTEDSQVTDELLVSLNEMAFAHARHAAELPQKQQTQELNRALNIYLANLKTLAHIKEQLESGERSQAGYPLLNCDLDNLNMCAAEIKAHISEILWTLGSKKSAIAWGEEVVHEIYFDHGRVAKASPILDGVLRSLKIMYANSGRPEDAERSESLRKGLNVFERGQNEWYEHLIKKITKIMYNKGPLGVIEKALAERVGPPKPVPDIEHFEEEDDE